MDDNKGAAIGRRYARTDAIGIPFGITVDFDTVESSSVTLRERNSTRQVCISVSQVDVATCHSNATLIKIYFD